MQSKRTWAKCLLLVLPLGGSRALTVGPISGSPLRAIFSDIDGTLVHYAKDFEKHGVRLVTSDEEALTAIVEGPGGDRRACRLLPSATMGPACVSERTIELVDSIRSHGVLFGVVTAARKSTMLKRWPLLPECDVRVCEAGSRIWVGDRLDEEYATRFESVCGPIDREVEGAETRPEPLWRFYRQLRDEIPGLELDAKSYFGMFRARTRGNIAVDSALRAKIESALPADISWATNLGHFDFYPSAAGKGEAVVYLQKKFGITRSETACLFDDDNDLPMAKQCGIQMLPGLTSESVEAAAARHPSWQIAEAAGQGVFAIEECLEAILQRVKEEQQQQVMADDIDEIMSQVEAKLLSEREYAKDEEEEEHPAR